MKDIDGYKVMFNHDTKEQDRMWAGKEINMIDRKNLEFLKRLAENGKRLSRVEEEMIEVILKNKNLIDR